MSKWKKTILDFDNKRPKGTLSSTTEQHFMGYNFMGKGTLAEERLTLNFDGIRDKIKSTSSETIPSFLPINKLDLLAVLHDIAYMSNNPLVRIWADEQFQKYADKTQVFIGTRIMAKNLIQAVKGNRQQNLINLFSKKRINVMKPDIDITEIFSMLPISIRENAKETIKRVTEVQRQYQEFLRDNGVKFDDNGRIIIPDNIENVKDNFNNVIVPNIKQYVNFLSEYNNIVEEPMSEGPKFKKWSVDLFLKIKELNSLPAGQSLAKRKELEKQIFKGLTEDEEWELIDDWTKVTERMNKGEPMISIMGDFVGITSERLPIPDNQPFSEVDYPQMGDPEAFAKNVVEIVRLEKLKKRTDAEEKKLNELIETTFKGLTEAEITSLKETSDPLLTFKRLKIPKSEPFMEPDVPSNIFMEVAEIIKLESLGNQRTAIEDKKLVKLQKKVFTGMPELAQDKLREEVKQSLIFKRLKIPVPMKFMEPTVPPFLYNKVSKIQELERKGSKRTDKEDELLIDLRDAVFGGMTKREETKLRGDTLGFNELTFKSNIFFPTREVGDKTAVLGIDNIKADVVVKNRYNRRGKGKIDLVTNRAKRVDRLLSDVQLGSKVLKTSVKGGEGVNSITAEEFNDIIDAVRLKEIPLTRTNILFQKFNEESVLVNDPLLSINPKFSKNPRSLKTVLPQLFIMNQLENNPKFSQRLALELSRLKDEKGVEGIAGRDTVKINTDYNTLVNPNELTPEESSKARIEALDMMDAEKLSDEDRARTQNIPVDELFNFFSKGMRNRREEAKQMRERQPETERDPKTAEDAMLIINRIIAEAENDGISLSVDKILELETRLKEGKTSERELMEKIKDKTIAEEPKKFEETPIDLEAKIGPNGIDLSGVGEAINKANVAGVGELASGGLDGSSGTIPPAKATQYGGIGGESRIRARFRQRRPFFIHYGTGLITETPEKQAEDADAFANFNWIPQDGNFEDGSDNIIVKSQKFNDALRYSINWIPEVPKQRSPLSKTIMKKLEIPMIRDNQNIQKMTEYEDGANFGIIKLYPVNPEGHSNMFDKLENRLIFPSMVDGERV